MVNVLAWQVAKLCDLPVVYTYHTMSTEYVHYWLPFVKLTPLMNSAVKWYDKFVCNAADIVITPSQKAAEYLSWLHVSPQVCVIPNGIDGRRFHPYPSRFLQEQYSIPNNHKVLLFVGRLNQEKRPILAYRIFRDLCARRGDVSLVMVGDGPARATIEALAAYDGLSSRVHLTGIVPYHRMPDVYNSANVWISTSTSEVQPMAGLEATACGLPAVVMADKALDGVIRDGANGFVVTNQVDFVRSVDRLLDDPLLCGHMHTAAAAIGHLYDVNQTALHLSHLYRSVILTH